MANRFIERIIHGPSDADAAPLGGTRAQALHRLQIGVSGIVVMIMLVALADVVRDRADQAEAESVPDAAATTAPETVDTPQSDPLADAGVVPDLPAEPAATPTQEPAILPEQGRPADGE